MGVGTGRNKLIINHLGRLFVTSDAAMVMASTAQETEVSYSCKAWAVWEAAGRGEGWRTRG
jgi:hypothetical protein